MYVIADYGSCHHTKKSRAKALAHAAYKAGCSAVKCQLLTDAQLSHGNKELPWDWVAELKRHAEDMGLTFFASVFDRAGMQCLEEAGIQTIKIAYSMRHKLLDEALARFKLVYVSCDTNDQDLLRINKPSLRRLFCVPEYPVRYTVDWYGPLRTHRFHGISDHTLGYHQTITAAATGLVTIVEKHLRMDWNDDKTLVPDEAFALGPKDMTRMIEKLNKICPRRVA